VRSRLMSLGQVDGKLVRAHRHDVNLHSRHLSFWQSWPTTHRR
jgi:hypothetical protein